MVQVNTSTSAFSVTANAVNSTNQVIAGRNSSYYTLLAREWAISPNLVQNTDYSAKYYADKSKEYADSILTDTGFIAVTESLTTINVVADDLTNINAAVANETNINAVVANATNINAAVANESNINSAVANETNINAVVTNESNINLVAGDKTNIDIVAAAKTNIDTNAIYINNINTTALYINKINTVSNYVTQIDTIDNYVNDINTCSANIANINTCAANISTIGDKVSKTGDTMTGDLTINKATPLYILKNTDLDKTSTTAPSSNIDSAVQVQDKNGQYISNFYTAHTQGNEFQQGLDLTRTINNVEGHAYFGIGLNANNEEYVSASNGVKQSITNWAFPSSRYDELALGASGTQYTAPADGYVYVGGTQFANSGYMFLSNDANGMQVVAQPPNVSTFEVRCIMPLAKGQQYTIFYGDLYINVFRFVYAIGD